jgi:hypothetical protein
MANNVAFSSTNLFPAPAEVYNVRQGDWTGGAATPSVALQLTVTDADGVAVDLSDYDTIKFHMIDSEGETVTLAGTASGTLASGILKFSWADGDLDTPGNYRGVFRLGLNADNTHSLTIPTRGYLKITVHATDSYTDADPAI